MKRLVFLSGKGGTGKTTLAAALASMARGQVVADCDVDAANLHLLLDPTIREEGTFQGSALAVRDETKCTSCGACREVCRFDAIDEVFTVDPYLCEGCGACVTACPVDAIRLEPCDSGRWYTAHTAVGPMASAELHPAEETSGKLVTLVKRKADALAADVEAERVLIDGSPGIGCPVIASVVGVQAAVLVAEPSLSGLHDLERILGVVRHFGIPAYVVINKHDLSDALTQRIETYAGENDVPVLGRIPYDPKVVEAMVEGKSIVEADTPAGASMREILARLLETLA